MGKIAQGDVIAKLPEGELRRELEHFLEPVLDELPDMRLRRTALRAVEGIMGAKSPVITRMAQAVAGQQGSTRPLAKRLYRLVWNQRLSHRHLLKGMYAIARREVERLNPSPLVVALDPVNLEKPYTRSLEGVSTVMKSTPPGPKGDKRLTSGYPAITATIVNLPQPLITYAQWFSYVADDFISENRHLRRAIRTTRALFPSRELCFVGDAGLDDRKIFEWVGSAKAQFIFRSCQDRRVEVYNHRLDRWEQELLYHLTGSVPLEIEVKASFTHARRVRVARMGLGWLKIRLVGEQQPLWALVAHDLDEDEDVVLITNIPIQGGKDAVAVYRMWRLRPQIEHIYRFDQEDGLDVENMRVQTLERMRRMFVLVLLAALFVHFIAHNWPQEMVLWLRWLGGKLGLASDCDGPYLLLAGIRAVLITSSTLRFAAKHPFPELGGSCG